MVGQFGNRLSTIPQIKIMRQNLVKSRNIGINFL